jgi:hypothetical protein
MLSLARIHLSLMQLGDVMKKMRFGVSRFTYLALAIWLIAAALSSAQEQSHAVVVSAFKHAIAPPLSQLTPLAPREENDLEPDEDSKPLRSPHLLGANRDSALQTSDETILGSVASNVSTSAGVNILGLGSGFSGYSIQAVVPDTNGAAGATQFVQFVNDSFAVFNKSNGSLAYGPAGGNTLWQALGAPCSSNTNLDEIAQYDKLAGRWVMMMPVFASPVYLCVAVSSTSDAVNGSWNLYAFELPVSSLCGCRMMPDYPKLAVWPDGYYITYDQGWNLNYEGPAACVVNRNNMLSGDSATMQCFANTGASYGVLLPADVDGTTPPPSGTPEYLLNFDGNDESLDLWQFHVNWTTPADSTFTGPTNIPVAAFTEPCGETIVELNYTTGACVPQSGTSQELDSYGDRLMYRLAYRNFASYQDLVVNHTVNTGSGSQTGIRWYELRNSGSGFGVYQQGTYAPDASYRWMGSVAMDHVGDIAIGYSVSSSSMSPTIRYAGRVPSDTLGTMEAETDVLAAAGVSYRSKTNTYRWGDYSSMAIDPTDDCTFWYATEYVPSSGNWSTRIASFSFPSCTGAPPPPWSVVSKASQSGGPPPLTSLAIPSTVQGNAIVVALIFNGTTSVSSISDNAGNTYVSGGAKATVANFTTEIWYALNSNAGATSITPTFVGSPTHVEMSEWQVSGLANTPPDAANSSNGSVVSSNTAGPAVTASQAGDFIVSIMYAGAVSFSGTSSGNAFSNDFATNGRGWAHLTSSSAAAGSYHASWVTSNTPAGKYCASTVAFLAAN